MKAFFTLVTRLFPTPFRARFGPEVVDRAVGEVERAARTGRLKAIVALIATTADVMRSAALEHVSPTRMTGPETVLEREGWWMLTSEWIRELRIAGRTLRKSPGFVVVSVATLALAIGVNAGIFSVVDTVLLKPLPFEEPDRLVYIAASAPGSDFPEEFGVSAEFLVQYEEEADLLQGVATFNSFTATLRVGDRTERVRMSFPSRSLFEVLGTPPAMGRLPTLEDGEEVIVLSHAAWVDWFGSDPTILGRAPFVIDRARTIIGVMPPEFRFPDRVLLWIPSEELDAAAIVPGRFGMQLVARMTPGADRESVTRQLSALALRLPERFGGSARYAALIERHIPVVRSLDEELLGPVAGALWILMGSVLVVLVIAFANVANLFSVRVEGRGRDLAVRSALGAARGKLIRSLMSEALLVAVVSGALALGFAALALPIFLSAVPATLPRLEDVNLSTTTMVFTGLITGLAALVCGLSSAVRASNPRLSRLRDGRRGSTGRRLWGGDGLVVGQTALALVLLVGSGLLFRSFSKLNSVDPGYETEDIFTFQFAPDQSHLVDGPTWAQFHMGFMERLRALPGVASVGIVENVPLDEGVTGVSYFTEQTIADPESARMIRQTFAGGDYFETMGIAVLAGRPLDDQDVSVPGNVVISQLASDLLWPDQSPIGRRIQSTQSEDWHTVVGVVEDVLQSDFRTAAEPMVYHPLAGPTPDSWALPSPGYVVRTTRAATIAPEIREVVREVAPEAPMYRTYTMVELATRSMARLSFTMLTLAVAAGLALFLGAIGLYGVLSYVVAQRTQEIGVRIALGAAATRVRWMVVAQATRGVVLGVGVGLLAAVFSARALGSLLYGVEAFDLGTFSGTALIMVVVGLVASYVPARRASLVHPLESMRVT